MLFENLVLYVYIFFLQEDKFSEINRINKIILYLIILYQELIIYFEKIIPFLYKSNNSLVSSLVNTLIFDVFTPVISTL